MFDHHWVKGFARRPSALVLLLLVLSLPGCVTRVVPLPPGAEVPDGDTENRMPLITETFLRSRLMDIPSQLQHPEDLRPGHVLEITLFEDAQYRAHVRTITRDVTGTLSLTADVEGYPGGSVIAVEAGGRFLITIDIPSERKNYIIRFDFKAERYRVDELLIQELHH